MGYLWNIVVGSLMLVCCWSSTVSGQAYPVKGSPNVNFYNVDSLLQTFCTNADMRTLLDEGSALYDKVGLKDEDLCKNAFKIAYLVHRLIELHKLQADRCFQTSLIKKNILVVVDYTKSAYFKRLAVVDLDRRMLLHNTMVSHGAGNDPFSDPREEVPTNFSDREGSNLSSLGCIVTLGLREIYDDCHICRFNRDSLNHACQIDLSGLELDINERIARREIIIHTTGSKNWADPSISDKPKFNHPLYYIKKNGKTSICHLDKGEKGSQDYAAAEYIDTYNYIGRSDGCLVLPEEQHIGVIRDIMNGSMIFSYSNVISKTSNYFANSPLITQIRRLATGVPTPVFAAINSKTENSWDPAWNDFVYEEVMRHRSTFIHNDFLPKDDIDKLWPQFYAASDEQRGAFWVMVVASLARFNSSFASTVTTRISPEGNLAQGLLQLSYSDANTYAKWDMDLSQHKGNILDPKVNLQTGVVILAAQLENRKALFDVSNGNWPLLKFKKEAFIAFFKASSQGLKQ